MSDETAPFPPAAQERRLSGVAKVFLGFIVGVLFALAPMYFYMGRAPALRSASPAADEPASGHSGAASAGGAAPDYSAGVKPFASRLSYELSQAPEEPIAPITKRPAVAMSTSSVPAATAEHDLSTAAARVSNARPISAMPPQPRDRTQAIEREARRSDSREPPQAPVAAVAREPRIIEGREVKLPDTPTRPILAGGAVNTRAEIEAERSRPPANAAPAPAAAGQSANRQSGTIVADAPAAGATPVRKPAESAPRKEGEAQPQSAPVGVSSGTHGSASGGAIVEARLAATREWLAAAPHTMHTIQLMGAANEEQLQMHLKSLAKLLEPTKIYVFRTVAQGKPSLTVAYGAYPDRQAALQALEKLPAALAENRPVLRTVNGIRAEMKQHKTDG